MDYRSKDSADVLIRAGSIHTMSFDGGALRAIALRGDSIVALSGAVNGLDDLVTPDTRVVDDPSLTVLPAFNDTHNHLLEATRNATFLPVNQARNLAEFVVLVRERAAHMPAGQWIQTSNAWHEEHLEEHRLPTADDLDQATRNHPVLVRRGGHMAVVNSCGLQEAHHRRDARSDRRSSRPAARRHGRWHPRRRGPIRADSCAAPAT